MLEVRYLASLILSVFLASSVCGQVYFGIITDAGTNDPLPYVNVGVNGKDLGVISNEAGLFEIDLSSASDKDSLYITSVGYDLEIIPIKSLKGGQIGIRLYPRNYFLREVNIGGLRMQSREKLGPLKPAKTTLIYERDAGLGEGKEWGLRIENYGERYLLQDINFHLRLNTADSALFRLNLYGMEGDMPGESILRDPIYIKSYKRDKWVNSDLSAQNVIIDEPVIAAIEVIHVWNHDSDLEIHFSHGEGYESSNSYSRDSSFANWQKNEYPPLTLYLTGRIF